jgi:hypothetical protein
MDRSMAVTNGHMWGGAVRMRRARIHSGRSEPAPSVAEVCGKNRSA